MYSTSLTWLTLTFSPGNVCLQAGYWSSTNSHNPQPVTVNPSPLCLSSSTSDLQSFATKFLPSSPHALLSRLALTIPSSWSAVSGPSILPGESLSTICQPSTYVRLLGLVFCREPRIHPGLLPRDPWGLEIL